MSFPCTNCGHELPDEATGLCPHCGEPVEWSRPKPAASAPPADQQSYRPGERPNEPPPSATPPPAEEQPQQESEVGDEALEPCPACGTPNPPDRQLCRLCGADLKPAPSSPPPTPPPPTEPSAPPAPRRKPRLPTRALIIGGVVVAVLVVGLLFWANRGVKGTVTGDGVNVRDGPSGVIVGGLLNTGDTVRVTCREGEWLRLSRPLLETGNYVFDDFVNLESEVDSC
jgi:hypothetical protein